MSPDDVKVAMVAMVGTANKRKHFQKEVFLKGKWNFLVRAHSSLFNPPGLFWLTSFISKTKKNTFKKNNTKKNTQKKNREMISDRSYFLTTF